MTDDRQEHGRPTREERQRADEEIARGRIRENQRMATARHGDTPHAGSPDDGVGVMPGEPKATRAPPPDARRPLKRAAIAFVALAIFLIALYVLA